MHSWTQYTFALKDIVVLQVTIFSGCGPDFCYFGEETKKSTIPFSIVSWGKLEGPCVLIPACFIHINYLYKYKNLNTQSPL